jgi:hypothetical protein
LPAASNARPLGAPNPLANGVTVRPSGDTLKMVPPKVDT